jgi:hypothetical protein
MMDHVPYLLGAATVTKQVSFRAGGMHTTMKLKDRMPAVATALERRRSRRPTERDASGDPGPTTARI